jgi:hypothetical protein
MVTAPSSPLDEYSNADEDVEEKANTAEARTLSAVRVLGMVENQTLVNVSHSISQGPLTQAALFAANVLSAVYHFRTAM